RLTEWSAFFLLCRTGKKRRVRVFSRRHVTDERADMNRKDIHKMMQVIYLKIAKFAQIGD
ncbi:MAG: hypothetical protein ACI39T_05085, partial [Candidatus Cryptobacteroides sp.]